MDELIPIESVATLAELKYAIAVMKARANKNRFSDNATLHIYQDELYEHVLHKIADGTGNPIHWAALALQVKDIEFSRWYE